MRLEDLNWMNVEEYLKQDDRLILIVGACEQHGYLSLLTDVKIPQALADAASKQTGVLVAPALNFGSSPFFLAYPGTLSFRLTTLMDAGEDLVRSAYQQGFRRLLVLNGHGGNSGLRARLVEIIGGMPGLKMQWFEWWQAHSVEATAMAHGLKPAHANWLEAFPFTRVSELPEDEKLPPSVPSSILDPDSARQIYGDGNFGGPYVAANEIMEAVFSAALQDVLELLKFGEG